MTGRSGQVSFAAISAARHSCRLIMVSTTSRSTPASTRYPICSRYTVTSSSKSILPMGESCSPVMVRSPAISVPFPAARLEASTRARFSSRIFPSRPYSASLIRLAVKVGAYRMSVPASTYSFCRPVSTSGCSVIHSSGQTPPGIPRDIRLEPVAPSSRTISFSITKFLNSCLFINFLLPF